MLRAIVTLWTAALAFAATAGASELKIVGTGDGLEMLRAVAVEFGRKHPDIKISLPASIGSGGGIVAVVSNTERLGRVARPLTESEKAQGLVYIPIAKIPSAFFVHPSVKIHGLTTQQLVQVYSGRAQSWKELGGADLDIKVVRREEADSTLQVLRASMPGWSKLEITPRSKTAVTTQEAIQTVREVEGTVGFGPYSRTLDFETNVLRIDGRFPTDEGYPSSVELALIYKNGHLDKDMKAFIDFCLSDNAARVIDTYGGVPIRN